jgi:hypothetical protein
VSSRPTSPLRPCVSELWIGRASVIYPSIDIIFDYNYKWNLFVDDTLDQPRGNPYVQIARQFGA